jgi:hypothetical protein
MGESFSHPTFWGVAGDSAANTIHEATLDCTKQRFLVRVILCEFVDRFSWPSANRGIEQIDIVAI